MGARPRPVGEPREAGPQPAPRVEVRRRDGGLELRVDDTFASWYRPGETCTGSVWDAIAVPLLALPAARRRRIAILGLGGGSVARVVRALAPRAEIVGVEISAAVLRAARRTFGLDALDLRAVRADAREWLRSGTDRFDAILDDVFVGRGRRVRKPAWHGQEGIALMARRLAPGGLIVSNTLDEWRPVAEAVRGLLPAALVIEVVDYDNRIVVGGPSGLTGRQLRRLAAASPLLAPSCRVFRFRSLPPRGRGRAAARAPGRRKRAGASRR